VAARVAPKLKDSWRSEPVSLRIPGAKLLQGTGRGLEQDSLGELVHSNTKAVLLMFSMYAASPSKKTSKGNFYEAFSI
jgi:hypothetical protein